MLRKNLRKINLTKLGLLGIISLPLITSTSSAFATATCGTNSTSGLYECSDSSLFKVNVNEILTISVTKPSQMASGDAGDFLRNKISVDVSSNSGYGFVASMYSKDSTNLTNPAATTNNIIPTLQSSYAQSAFPANYWGYSFDDINTAISGTSNYSAMQTVSTPVTLITNAQSLDGTNHKDVAFGAKADSSKPAGTYSNTVVISVVSGTISEDNPVVPTDPVTPEDQPNPNYDEDYTDPSTNTVVGRTSYTTTTTDAVAGTTTTTTEITTGDNTGSYASPQGVTNKVATTTNIGEGTPLATGLAVTAGVAAASGIFFFILAKRKKDDDEEEDQ